MSFYKRFYLILKKKLLIIKNYINKYFKKGVIRLNILLLIVFILFTKK